VVPDLFADVDLRFAVPARVECDRNFYYRSAAEEQFSQYLGVDIKVVALYAYPVKGILPVKPKDGAYTGDICAEQDPVQRVHHFARQKPDKTDFLQ